MTGLIILAFLLLLATVFFSVSFGLRVLEAQRRKQVQSIVAVVGGGARKEELVSDLLLLPGREESLHHLRIWRATERQLRQAGLNWSVSQLAAATIVFAAIGAAAGWYLRPLGFLSLSAIALAALLGCAPYLFVLRKRRRRIGEIEEQLPEALDFLARSMRAGHAFSISLEMLSRELPDPLGQEFRALFNELNLGASTETALHNLSDRIPLLDVRLFVSSVLLQKQTGGSLSEILVRLAYVIRERFRLRGQVRVASAHGRLTAAVLSLLPVFVVISLLVIAPGYLKALAEDPDGKWMISGAIAAQAAGYFIMHRIVNIKV